MFPITARSLRALGYSSAGGSEFPHCCGQSLSADIDFRVKTQNPSLSFIGKINSSVQQRQAGGKRAAWGRSWGPGVLRAPAPLRGAGGVGGDTPTRHSTAQPGMGVGCSMQDSLSDSLPLREKRDEVALVVSYPRETQLCTVPSHSSRGQSCQWLWSVSMASTSVARGSQPPLPSWRGSSVTAATLPTRPGAGGSRGQPAPARSRNAAAGGDRGVNDPPRAKQLCEGVGLPAPFSPLRRVL